ncbi:MAG: zinc ribbon domain-containing protein [bacterium]|nr:zinc ribbon domain-containing protein [bacterium]
MGFIYGFLGVICGFVFIIISIYLLIRYFLNRFGFQGYSFLELFSIIKEGKERDISRHKQVSGMTSVYLPSILEEFPDFNEKEFYNQTEETIRNYLQSLEEKDAKYLKDSIYDLIYEKISLQIADLKECDTIYRYDDIIFHKHAIKGYQKRKGVIKLEVSTSLEYFYLQDPYRKRKTARPDRKKQTRYTTTFVYIYDTKQAGFDIRVLGLNCPNCGSPLSSLEDKACPYCKSGLNITVAKLLKCWKVIDIQEDY